MGNNLIGVVDLGTFSIRFSITSINPKHARILPTVFQDKAPVALMRGTGVNIKDDEIEEALTLLHRFRSICDDYGVSRDNVRVAANAQEAPNAEHLFSLIKSQLGWQVLRLGKQSEAWTSVYGVASSFYQPCGVYIELRSSAAYVYWIDFRDGKEIAKAAEEIDYPSINTGNAVNFGNLSARFRKIYTTLVLQEQSERSEPLEKPETAGRMASANTDDLDEHSQPDQPSQSERNSSSSKPPFPIYLSATGFPGIHLKLLELLHDIPMPLSNGLEIQAHQLLNTRETVGNTSSSDPLEGNMVALLHELGKALDSNTRILYCRHNIRDGLLFQGLPAEIRVQDPLVVATQPYALPGATRLAKELLKALPPTAPDIITKRLVIAVSQAAYIHSAYPKGMQSCTALCVALTGVISGTHGLTHCDRAILGLALCNRWGGDMAQYHYRKTRSQLIDAVNDRTTAWWALYLGLVLYLLGGAYPGAHVRPDIVNMTVTPHLNGFRLHINIPPSLFGDNAVMRQRIRQLPARFDALDREFGKAAPNLSMSLI